MIVTGNNRILYIMNDKTEAYGNYSGYLTCVQVSKGGAGNSVSGRSDREALILIHVFADPCFCLCVGIACLLIQDPTLYRGAAPTVPLAM